MVALYSKYVWILPSTSTAKTLVQVAIFSCLDYSGTLLMDFSTLLLAICDACNNQTIVCVSQIRSLFCQESSTCFPTYLKSKVLFLPMWLDTGQLQQVSHWLPLCPAIIVPQPRWPSQCSSNMPSMLLLWKLRTCCSFCLISILLSHWGITDSSFWLMKRAQISLTFIVLITSILMKYHPCQSPSS